MIRKWWISENIKEHNSNWLPIPDHAYRIKIIGCSGYGIINLLSNLIIHQPYIDKICLFAKDLHQSELKFVREFKSILNIFNKTYNPKIRIYNWKE